MPNKYPGGYKIIDLGGVLIDEESVVIPGIFNKIITSTKPVLLTNFRINPAKDIGLPMADSAFVMGLDSDKTSAFAYWRISTSGIYGLYIGDDDVIEVSAEEF